MLGSQIIDINPRIAGADLSVPEVRLFGYCKFREAVRTNDDWTSHSGPEIVFLLNGEACWEDGDEHLVQAVGGQAVVFPARMRHRILNAVYAPSESLWILMRGPDEVAQPALLTRDAHAAFCRKLDQGQSLYDLGDICLGQLVDLARLLVDPAIFSGGGLIIAELRAKLHSVLLEIWKTCERDQAPVDHGQLVGQAKRYLHEHWDEPITIAGVANVLGCSRGHLHAIFRRSMGMSPNDYLQRLRIKKCCQRLVSTADPITTVAFDSGFESAQYFARVFRKYLSFTPSEFRNRLRTPGGRGASGG